MTTTDTTSTSSAPVSIPPAEGVPPTFDALPLSPEVRRAIDEIGWVTPTPVQLATWEPAASGRDLCVQARTGTGKTAAFAIPLVDRRVRDEAVVQALILAPTRELALQSARELERIGVHRGVKTAAIYGGASMDKQVRELEDGVHVVSGTPGRVLDHLRRGTLKVDHLRVLILDEADEMLSMGFAKELNAIVELLPKTRQTWLFSATLDEQVQRMTSRMLKDPIAISLSSDAVGAQTIAHFVYLVSGAGKSRDLVRILETESPESAIIFCNTKVVTEQVAAELQAAGYSADWLNGDLPQNDREDVLRRTRQSELRFLVATDVAARGIDISHLTHVINYDFPDANEGYVHRTGRTGRAGRTGTAISIITPQDLGQLYYLRLQYKIFPIERSLPSSGEAQTRAELDRVEMLAAAFPSEPSAKDLAIARRILAHDDVERLVGGLVRAFLGTAGDEAEIDEQAAATRRARPPRPVVDADAESAPREARAPRRARESREPRETREGREPRESREGREPRESREGREPREPSASLETREPREPGPGLETREPLEGESPSTDGDAGRRRRRREREPGERREPGAEPARARSEEPRRRDESGEAGAEPERPESVLFLNVGRRDGVRVVDFLRLFEDKAGLGKNDLGRIRIRDKHTFVAVPLERTEEAIERLKGSTFGDRELLVEVAKNEGEAAENGNGAVAPSEP